MKSLLSVGDMKKPFGIFGCCLYYLSVRMLAEDYRRVEKDISHLKWKFLFKCFIGCLNIRKDFAMSWEICSWSVSVMGITDSSLPRYTLLIWWHVWGNRLKPKQSVCDSCSGSGGMLLSAVKKCAEENDGGRLFCYGSDIDLICVKMTVVNLMMNSVPSEVTWMNTLTMQHWRSYHIDLQLMKWKSRRMVIISLSDNEALRLRFSFHQRLEEGFSLTQTHQ